MKPYVLQSVFLCQCNYFDLIMKILNSNRMLAKEIVVDLWLQDRWPIQILILWLELSLGVMDVLNRTFLAFMQMFHILLHGSMITCLICIPANLTTEMTEDREEYVSTYIFDNQDKNVKRETLKLFFIIYKSTKQKLLSF